MDPSLRSLTIGTDVIQPVDFVRDLGVYFDSHLTMKAHEQGRHFNFFLGGKFFFIFQCHRTIEKLEKNSTLYVVI